MKCCFCEKEFEGYGNNPWGAMCRDAISGKIVDLEYNPEDRCCDECNTRLVIPGRYYKLSQARNLMMY